jgi:hypothetical protein
MEILMMLLKTILAKKREKGSGVVTRASPVRNDLRPLKSAP